MTKSEIRARLGDEMFSDGAIRHAVSNLEYMPAGEITNELFAARIMAIAYDAGVDAGYYAALERAGIYGETGIE